jgi:hypothetical protein
VRVAVSATASQQRGRPARPPTRRPIPHPRRSGRLRSSNRPRTPARTDRLNAARLRRHAGPTDRIDGQEPTWRSTAQRSTGMPKWASREMIAGDAHSGDHSVGSDGRRPQPRPPRISRSVQCYCAGVIGRWRSQRSALRGRARQSGSACSRTQRPDIALASSWVSSRGTSRTVWLTSSRALEDAETGRRADFVVGVLPRHIEDAPEAVAPHVIGGGYRTPSSRASPVPEWVVLD